MKLCRLAVPSRASSLLGVGLLLLVGCGDSRGLVPASGTVSYQGKPLEQGVISFISPQTREASAQIVDGEFTGVTSFEKNDGIAPGDYTVIIKAYDRSKEYPDTVIPPSLIPKRYGSPSDSGLTATISTASDNVLQFNLD